MFTAEEVAKLKELGVLNPPNAPGHLLLFLLLVPSHQGKVVSTALGAPPPNLDADGIGQSFATDQDEESILSDSYLDRHSNPWTAAPCGAGILCTAQKGNRNHGPLSARTEIAISLVTKTVTEIMTGNVRNLKRAMADMVQIGLTDALPDTRTMTVSMALMANVRDCVGMRVHLRATKQSRDVE